MIAVRALTGFLAFLVALAVLAVVGLALLVYGVICVFAAVLGFER